MLCLLLSNTHLSTVHGAFVPQRNELFTLIPDQRSHLSIIPIKSPTGPRFLLLLTKPPCTVGCPPQNTSYSSTTYSMLVCVWCRKQSGLPPWQATQAPLWLCQNQRVAHPSSQIMTEGRAHAPHPCVVVMEVPGIKGAPFASPHTHALSRIPQYRSRVNSPKSCNLSEIPPFLSSN